MRLLHVRTNRIESFHSSEVPAYAILSHTWGQDEVTFQDFSSSRRKQAGWAKIHGACAITKQQGLEYIWIDTCCIDKTSSSELSEAINSMFQWYKGALICFALLEDIEDPRTQDPASLPEIQGARWFTRGWTLQELIAAKDVVFYSKGWKQLGTKSDVAMRRRIQKITSIDETILLHPERLPTVSIARRMSWASLRETTRSEDIAYCLMGLFGVNMPLLYGEGTNAFIRLQEEIIKDSEDESIFSWNWKSQEGNAQKTALARGGVLAQSPQYFSSASDLLPYRSKLEPYAMSNRGLRIQMAILQTSSRYKYLGILHCRYKNDLDGSIAIPLRIDGTLPERFYRDISCPTTIVSIIEAKRAKICTVYIHKFGEILAPLPSPHCHMRNYPKDAGIHFVDAIFTPAKDPQKHHFPRPWILRPGEDYSQWNLKERAMIVHENDLGYFAALKFRFTNDVDSLESKDSVMFAAILELPTRLSARVWLGLLQERKETTTEELAHVLQTSYVQAKGPHASLDTQIGIIEAKVSRESFFGEDMFLLDIELVPVAIKPGLVRSRRETEVPLFKGYHTGLTGV